MSANMLPLSLAALSSPSEAKISPLSLGKASRVAEAPSSAKMSWESAGDSKMSCEHMVQLRDVPPDPRTGLER